MDNNKLRVSENLLVEQEEDEVFLKYREEAGRGKRFGMDGQIQMSEDDAERFAKWVFARELSE